MSCLGIKGFEQVREQVRGRQHFLSVITRFLVLCSRRSVSKTKLDSKRRDSSGGGKNEGGLGWVA